MRARLLVPLLLAVASPASGQAASAATSSSHLACLDALPPTAFARSVAFLVNDYRRTTAIPGVGPADVDLFTEDLAVRIRALIDTTAGALPAAEPMVDWRDFGPRVDIEVRGQGEVSWRERPVGAEVASISRRTGPSPLARVLESLVANGERFPLSAPLTDTVLRFSLGYATPTRAPDGTVTPAVMRIGFPVFTVMLPWSTPGRPLRGGSGRLSARILGLAGGRIEASYVVGADGIPIPETVALTGRPFARLPSAEAAQAEADAIEEIRRNIAGARTQPPTKGGCPVPISVVVSFF